MTGPSPGNLDEGISPIVGRGRYLRYPAYKNSGIGWLGEIPAHWPTARMWQVSEAISGGTPTREFAGNWNGSIPWVSPKDMKQRLISDTEEKITELALSESGLRLIQPPALLVVVRGMILAHSFPVGLLTVPATFNQDMKSLKIDSGVEPRFFAWLLDGVSQHILATAVEIAGHGTRAVRMDQWRSIELSLPTVSEQRSISDHLDSETAKIDALVAKKERLIELLRENRAALLTRAVTKGLNPDVPMKDSGIEWLGEIPAHWEQTPIKWRATCSSGYALPTDEISPESVPERSVTIPIIGGNGRMGYSSRSNTPYSVIAIGRVGALCGNIHLVLEPAWITDNALVLRVDQSLFDLRYLAEVLRSRNLNSLADQSAQPLITSTQVRAQRVPRPSLHEQRIIADHLDRETAKIDALVAKVQEATERLRELRTALISAAVTGKIDVRETAV